MYSYAHLVVYADEGMNILFFINNVQFLKFFPQTQGRHLYIFIISLLYIYV